VTRAGTTAIALFATALGACVEPTPTSVDLVEGVAVVNGPLKAEVTDFVRANGAGIRLLKLLRIPGGDYDATAALAALIRERALPVWVDGTCAGACAQVLLPASPRVVLGFAAEILLLPAQEVAHAWPSGEHPPIASAEWIRRTEMVAAGMLTAWRDAGWDTRLLDCAEAALRNPGMPGSPVPRSLMGRRMRRDPALRIRADQLSPQALAEGRISAQPVPSWVSPAMLIDDVSFVQLDVTSVGDCSVQVRTTE